LKYKNICIIGGSGSVGRLLLTILDKYNVSIYSRGEYEQYKLKKQYPNVKYIIGDIRDKEALNDALMNMDIVFHFAAIKHVSIGERNPVETVKTNVQGTQNVIEACKINKVKLLVYMSTDKSVHPINTYGCTKLIAEKMVMNEKQLDSIIIRSGNLVKSRGSAIPAFIEAKKQGSLIELTDEGMSRYFVLNKTLIKMFRLILEGNIKPNSLVIPKMKLIKIIDIIKALGCKYKVIGRQGGEKLIEELTWSQERLIDKGDYYLVRSEI
jgi:UDP-N-acetylglucosamine 4,6-dehydratase/5-epimerase